MSAKQENERLRAEVASLTSALKESRADAAAHLRNIEPLTDKAARVVDAEAALYKAHRDRDTAWGRIGELERQLESRDAENAQLAGKLGSALAAIEAARAAAAWKPRIVR
ncbi:hypothetical protein [Streptacidiphilus sp. PAMC 29251]